jgi:hypothetical protein
MFQFNKFWFIVLRNQWQYSTHIQHNQLEEVAGLPADERDIGGYPFLNSCDKCWLTIDLIVRVDGQKFVGLLPQLISRSQLLPLSSVRSSFAKDLNKLR